MVAPNYTIIHSIIIGEFENIAYFYEHLFFQKYYSIFLIIWREMSTAKHISNLLGG